MVNIFLITHTILFVAYALSIFILIACLQNISTIFTLSKVYAIPMAVTFCCLTVFSAVMSIGYITFCVNNKTWLISYTIYFAFVPIFLLILIIFIHKKDYFAIEELKLIVNFAHNSEPADVYHPYKYVVGNLSCFGYSGCSEEECTTDNFPVDPTLPPCDVVASNAYSKYLNGLLGISYVAMILSWLHFIELIFKIKSFDGETAKSDSAALSRFVQMT